MALWTGKQVADYFQVTLKTIYSWEKAKHIPPGIRINGATRWDSEELERFVKQKANKE